MAVRMSVLTSISRTISPETACDTFDHGREVDGTNTRHDRDQLSRMAGQAKAAMGLQAFDVLADRGYFDGEEVLARAGIGVTSYVPKPLPTKPPFTINVGSSALARQAAQ
jgi:hypothetical protein